MSRTDETLGELLDRQAITAVLHQYIDGIERRDGATVAACFTEDATIEYGFDVTLRGRAEIQEFFARLRPGMPVLGLDRTASSMQQLPSSWITFDRDEADVRSEGMSSHAGWRGDEAIVILRSLSYRDRFRRVDGRWLIAWRRHTPRWMLELPAREINDDMGEHADGP